MQQLHVGVLRVGAHAAPNDWRSFNRNRCAVCAHALAVAFHL